VDRHLIVRRARPGETLRTLDNQVRQLSPEHIVVADASGPESLAGVMGGAETEVTDQTRNVLLEAAIWNPAMIRRMVQAFKLPSEASRRFERGVDPELPLLMQRRALELLRQVAGGIVAQGLVDVYSTRWQPQRIELTSAEVQRLLGIDLNATQVADLLTGLGFECEVGVDSVLVIVPSYRLDVSMAADLVEEVARMYGYHMLPATRLADELPPQYIDQAQLGERHVKDTLVGCGVQEVITYSLTSLETVATLDGSEPDAESYLALENPIAPERSILRRAILPELVQVLAANLREQSRVVLFEVGRVFHAQPGQVLPAEPRRLALVMAGQREPTSWHEVAPPPIDYFDLKGVVETLLERLGIAQQVGFVPADDPRFHPGRSAYLVATHSQNGASSARLGVLGELHPDVRDRLDLSVSRATAAELDLDALLQLRTPSRYEVIHRPPAVYQDIAVIAPTTVTAEQAHRVIQAVAGPLLESVHLFDVYTGTPIPEGQRSLAFRMRFRAPDRTLSDADVNKIREKIVRRLQSELGATTRT
jgi:phenylalanyl-tRNA synthetase beta chain